MKKHHDFPNKTGVWGGGLRGGGNQKILNTNPYLVEPHFKVIYKIIITAKIRVISNKTIKKYGQLKLTII